MGFVKSPSSSPSDVGVFAHGLAGSWPVRADSKTKGSEGTKGAAVDRRGRRGAGTGPPGSRQVRGADRTGQAVQGADQEVIESALNEEIRAHLGYDKHAVAVPGIALGGPARPSLSTAGFVAGELNALKCLTGSPPHSGLCDRCWLEDGANLSAERERCQ